MGVLDTFSLKDRVALVTGGAGLYGHQVTEALAEAGARTFIASRNIQNLRAKAREFQDRGLDVQAVKLDLGDVESIEKVHGELVKQEGRIDILVNNAVLRPMKSYNDPIENFEQSMQVNATGLFAISRMVGNTMARARRGAIINISSIMGVIGPDYWLYEEVGWDVPPDYFFHKGGMINFTRYLASKLGPYGVRVNTISPGGFFNEQPEGFLWRYNKRTFLGRMANDTDLKGAIVFFASDASAYITGANLMVDGGYTAK